MKEYPLFQKVNGALHPANAKAREVLSSLSSDKIYKADIKIPRNLERHCYYWKLINTIANHSSFAADTLHEHFKRWTGHYDLVTMPDGEVIKQTRSISFDRMRESEFIDYLNKVKTIIETDIIPQISDSPQALAEISNVLGAVGSNERAA